jgi:putative CocE/NonD family hydrolase
MLKEFLCTLAAAGILFPCTSGLSQPVPGVTIEHHVAMKTRDGVALYADIYRPAGEGNFPVLLQRTPYNRQNAADFGHTAAARGYMVVVQDVRGRYESEGEWYPFKHETDDGFDTVEWAAALPHANGKVGMFGGSYVGATQMLAAVGHPPHLAGICPVVTASNYHENWTYQGGAFEQWFNQSWTSGLAQDTFNRAVRAGTNALVGSSVLPLNQYPLFNMQLSSDPTSWTAKFAPYFRDWLDHPAYDSYWKAWAIEERFASIQVPALTVAAWYDIFQGGSLKNYVGLKAGAGNAAARAGQRLIVIVGGHAGNGPNVGAVDFGPDSHFDENAVTLEWYDYLFLGKQNEFATEKPVRLFVMGENKWRYEDDWPLARASEKHYFLHSSGQANTGTGDGSLSTDVAGPDKADSFTYDPADPVPTVGGPLCCDPEHLPAGPRDQREIEKRKDLAVYTTAELDQDTEVTGPVTLDLYAKSSAVDTDFTGKLVDVWPNGFAQNLTEGILRARYRNSTAMAEPIIPGKVYEYKIDLWSTSNLFLKGHKIRLEVSSSNFPRFDRNLNNGKDAGANSAFDKADNTIYHDREHPSALVLPVVPR